MPDDDFPPASVWLVGAGPGDPDLLTRKAEQLLRRASIVFYDALVGQGVLDLIPDYVRLVSVGKRSGRHSRDQDSISRLLVEAAANGERVVRLKGGDPAMFARSAEEIAELSAHGIAARICPGITAASAAAASPFFKAGPTSAIIASESMSMWFRAERSRTTPSWTAIPENWCPAPRADTRR